MRTLAIKLTLAFLFVGLMGAILVAFFVAWRTRQDFDRFVSDQNRYSLIATFGQYYQTNGSWKGVENLVHRGRFGYPRREGPFGSPVLVNTNGIVVDGGNRYAIGEQLPKAALDKGIPIEVDNTVVGWLLIGSPVGSPLPGSPEADFLLRTNRAIAFGALGATSIALLLGILLARTISRPVQELTTATQRIAQGELGHQVQVHTQDELGELASSFNRMSNDLARANQVRRQMTADIAHDLRTPLSVVLGYTEALSEGKLQGSPEVFSVMHVEAQRLRRLIDDLRTLSLADSGELTLTYQQLAPGDLLHRAAAAYRGQAEELGIRIQVDAPPDLPPINVDPDRMAQVLDNLITNALRYTPEGGTISLSAEPSPDQQPGGTPPVILRVQDDGVGISEGDLPHIFNRFYRADKSRLTNGESGLGLAIARSLTEVQGGSIAVESTQGEGTTFTIGIPTALPAQ